MDLSDEGLRSPGPALLTVMTGTPAGSDIWCGLDVGRQAHRACALDAAGRRVFDKELPQDHGVEPGGRTPSWRFLCRGTAGEDVFDRINKEAEELHPRGDRHEAAHLVIETNRTIATVATETNVGAQLLGRWVQQERDRMGTSPERPLDGSERAGRTPGCGWTTSSWEKPRPSS